MNIIIFKVRIELLAFISLTHSSIHKMVNHINFNLPYMGKNSDKFFFFLHNNKLSHFIYNKYSNPRWMK